jgi:dUTPase
MQKHPKNFLFQANFCFQIFRRISDGSAGIFQTQITFTTTFEIHQFTHCKSTKDSCSLPSSIMETEPIISEQSDPETHVEGGSRITSINTIVVELASYLVAYCGNNTYYLQTMDLDDLAEYISINNATCEQLIKAKEIASGILMKFGGVEPDPLKWEIDGHPLNKIALLRGYLDRCGKCEKENGVWSLRTEADEWLYQLLQELEIHYRGNDDGFFVFEASNCFDLACTLVQNYRIIKKRSQLLNIVTEVEGINTREIPVITVARTDPRAVMPSKVRHSDVGYDLTIIDVFKTKPCGTILFETGIHVMPPSGWYIEVVPRSGFIDKGWVMPNSVGIIDRPYIGSLKVPLIKISNEAVDLIPLLPLSNFQLILKPHIMSMIKEIDIKQFVPTDRADKGFNSRDRLDANCSLIKG